MNLIFRLAKQTDRKALIGLFSELQNYERSVYAGRVDPKGISEEYVDDMLNDLQSESLYQTFIAEYEGKVVAFSCAHSFDRMDEIVNEYKTYFIEDLVVTQKLRGKGIGKQFLDFITSYAKGRGFRQIGLSVLIANNVASKFYEAYGFEQYTMEYVKKI